MRAEYRHEKLKEKLERKAEEKEKEKKEEKPKVEVKKPKVNEVKAIGRFLPISFKHSVEICRMIRNKPVKLAERLLNEVIEMKRPVPFLRYNKEVAHRKGIAAGRYPVKAAKHILKVLKSAIANAKYLNLDVEKLYIKEIMANRAVSKERGGRWTHIHITLAVS